MIDNTQSDICQKNINSTLRRSNIINYLVNTNSFTKYLEIGIFDGFTFKEVNCDLKHGVEPGSEGFSISEVTHKMTSDDFFDICDESYDVILIDGLHEYKQVIKDFNNSISCINSGGYILFHDCNPLDELSQRVPRESICWNGDVWKAFVLIKQVNPTAFVLDTDFGIGVIKNNTKLQKVTETSLDLSWEDFSKNKKTFLDLRDIQNLDEIQ
tara:strand:- start:51040 stop:51675 length:636 start_codon:yes stop_codon:yes gene_type:complete